MKDNNVNESFEHASRVNIFFMKFIGILPLKGRKLNNVESIGLVTYAQICEIFLIVMYGSSLIRDICEGIVEVESISGTIGFTTSYMRVTFLCSQRLKIKQLFQESKNLYEDLDDADKLEIRKWVRLNAKITCVYVTNISFWIFSNLINPSISQNWLDLNESDIRLTPMYSGFNLQDSPRFEIMYVITTLLGWPTGFHFSCDMVLPFFILVACGHFKILSKKFETLEKQYTLLNYDKIYEEITSNIKYHKKILRYCDNIDEIAKGYLLIQIFASTYCLAIVALAILYFKRLVLLTILFALPLQLFICHGPADMLRTESEKLTKSVYIVPSIIRKDKKYSQIFCIIAMRSQKPIQLTAGGFINLSKERFSNMLSTCVSFFVVMSNFI